MPVVLTEEWLKSASGSGGGNSILHFHWPSYGYADRLREKMEQYVGEWGRTLALAKSLGFKIVWTVHNLYPHEQIYRDLEQKARRILLSECDATILHCQSAAALLQSHFGYAGRSAVIPHGHYGGIYGQPADRCVARSRLGLSGTVFLFFGQLRPYKGLEALIRAFRGCEDFSEDTLLIAGATMHADFSRRLLSLARDARNVVIHPFFIPDGEVALYLGGADVVVLPYAGVLTSGTAVLAHSIGRPVVAPRIGCLPETVPAGTGWLYDAEDEDDLLRALRLAKAEKGEAVSQRCLEFAARHHWGLVGEKTVELYSTVLTPGGEIASDAAV